MTACTRSRRSSLARMRATCVSGNTTKTHVARILAKLDLRDRVHAVIFAYQSGLRW